mmetsp:Transcript_16377/g.28081  ORF Transcript_16377/g.28081 Transcript_16377/m.28081 type:complete len:84 (-) Transcript_16377:84-335(-)
MRTGVMELWDMFGRCIGTAVHASRVHARPCLVGSLFGFWGSYLVWLHFAVILPPGFFMWFKARPLPVTEVHSVIDRMTDQLCH